MGDRLTTFFVAIAAACVPAPILFTTIGCSADYWAGAFKPTTKFAIGAGPYKASFEDSKNNTIHLGELVFDPITKTYKLANLDIVNNSSDVVNATSARALNVAVAQDSQTRYVDGLTRGIANIVTATGGAAKEAAPLVKAFLERVPVQQSIDVPIPGIGTVGLSKITGALAPESKPSQ